jgi:hypothetical protein
MRGVLQIFEVTRTNVPRHKAKNQAHESSNQPGYETMPCESDDAVGCRSTVGSLEDLIRSIDVHGSLRHDQRPRSRLTMSKCCSLSGRTKGPY